MTDDEFDARYVALKALVEYANPLNWDVDENGIRRVWKEPGSETPEAYNGFELAKAALSTAAQPPAAPQEELREDASYESMNQARRSDQGLMESEWGPMEDAPPHEDPPMHVAVVEGDDAVRTLQWNRDVAAFAYPVGTLLYAARIAKDGGA